MSGEEMTSTLGVSDGVTLGSLLTHLERLRDIVGFASEAPVTFRVANQYDRYDRITGHNVVMRVTG